MSQGNKKASQGKPLPSDGCPLGEFPIGACVLLEIDGISSWYLIAFCIGSHGDPHLRKLVHPPSSRDWNVGPSDTRQFSEHLIVLQSSWPLRVAMNHSEEDVDPMVHNLRLEVQDGVADLVGSDPRGGGP